MKLKLNKLNLLSRLQIFMVTVLLGAIQLANAGVITITNNTKSTLRFTQTALKYFTVSSSDSDFLIAPHGNYTIVVNFGGLPDGGESGKLTYWVQPLGVFKDLLSMSYPQPADLAVLYLDGSEDIGEFGTYTYTNGTRLECAERWSATHYNISISAHQNGNTTSWIINSGPQTSGLAAGLPNWPYTSPCSGIHL